MAVMQSTSNENVTNQNGAADTQPVDEHALSVDTTTEDPASISRTLNLAEQILLSFCRSRLKRPKALLRST